MGDKEGALSLLYKASRASPPHSPQPPSEEPHSSTAQVIRHQFMGNSKGQMGWHQGLVINFPGINRQTDRTAQTDKQDRRTKPSGCEIQAQLQQLCPGSRSSFAWGPGG